MVCECTVPLYISICFIFMASLIMFLGSLLIVIMIGTYPLDVGVTLSNQKEIQASLDRRC